MASEAAAEAEFEEAERIRLEEEAAAAAAAEAEALDALGDTVTEDLEPYEGDDGYVDTGDSIDLPSEEAAPFSQEGISEIIDAEDRVTNISLGEGQQVEGATIEAAAPGQAAVIEDVGGPDVATIGDVGGPEAATVGDIGDINAATVADIGGIDAADVAGLTGPEAAQVDVEDEIAMTAQERQIKLLTLIAQGDIIGPSLEHQRERGIQGVISQISSQRGVPTSTLIREGMRGIEEVERGVQEAAARQQQEALEALGAAAGQMRGQDIGVATTQAELEQQAELVGSGQAHEAALTEAGFEQEAQLTESEIAAQAALTEAGFEQEAELAGADIAAQAALTEAGFEQQAEIVATEQEQERAMRQAEFQQRANEMATEISSQTAAENAQMQQQMELQRVGLEQERLNQEASFQQEANMSNAQMEQARTIAEAQINAELRATENALISALTAQGVSLEIAEQRVGLEMELLQEELTYRYWAAREGAIVELGKFVMEKEWFWENNAENLDKNLDAVRLLIGQDLPGFVEEAIGEDPLAYGGDDPDQLTQDEIDIITGTDDSAEEIDPDML